MSATRGGADPSDLYITPAWAIDAVLPHVPIAGVVVDAGCGEGAILARVRASTDRCYLIGVELDAERAEVARGRMRAAHGGSDEGWRVDAEDWRTWGAGQDVRADLVIMNPAFSLAEVFLERALEIAAPSRGTVACLLPSDWHIPACRERFVKRHPFDLGYLRRRPSFAASLKCGAAPRCGWATMARIDATLPKACPGCGFGKVTRGTNDSSNYAWLLFGPGRGGRMFALDLPAEVA